MQKRYGEDSEFIIKGDKSVEAVRAWLTGLFEREDAKKCKLSQDALQWFIEVAMDAYEKAEGGNWKLKMIGKMIHTREVVKAGFDILRGDKDLAWNEYQVGTVCLLHDVARFNQALLGSFSDEKTKFDHGDEGAKMIEEHSFGDFETLGIDKQSVVESVKLHNKYEYLGEDMYVKIVRDADKLANLRALPEMLETNIEKFTKSGITDDSLKQYREKKMVKYDDISSKEDLLIRLLSWEFDFNFSSTNRLFVDEGTKEWMVKELAKMGYEV